MSSAPETPKDICVSLRETFLEIAGRDSHFPIIDRTEFSRWASRLERACQRLDAEKSPPEGPWRLQKGASGGPGFYVMRDSETGWPTSATVELWEREAIAVRDALNNGARRASY